MSEGHATTETERAGERAGGGLLRATLRALAAPRRALPILIVCLPLILAQGTLSDDPLAAPLGTVMCAACVTLAPYLWRRLGLTRGAWPAVLAPLLAYALLGVVVVWGLGWGVSRALSMSETFLTGREAMLVATALFWVGGWGLGRDLELEERLTRERARVRELEREAEQARALALQVHLDPHFLFNTLNAIAEWCRADGETAERAILELSSLLRTMLEGGRLGEWPLARELELVVDLFGLHRIRNPSLFSIEYDLPPHLAAVPIPPMLLLPLAENAMTHGPGAGHGGVVRLGARAEAGTLIVELENPGEYRGRREGGEGVAMVERRLSLAYGGAGSLELAARAGRTHACVRIPIAGRALAVGATPRAGSEP